MAASTAALTYFLAGRPTPAARARFVVDVVDAAVTWTRAHGEPGELESLLAVLNAACVHRTHISADDAAGSSAEEEAERTQS